MQQVYRGYSQGPHDSKSQKNHIPSFDGNGSLATVHPNRAHLHADSEFLETSQHWPGIKRHSKSYCAKDLLTFQLITLMSWSVPCPLCFYLRPSPHSSLCFSLVVHAFLCRPPHPNLPYVFCPFPTSLHKKSQRIISTERTLSSEEFSLCAASSKFCSSRSPNRLPFNLLSPRNFHHVRSFLELLLRKCNQRSIQHFPCFFCSTSFQN